MECPFCFYSGRKYRCEVCKQKQKKSFWGRVADLINPSELK